LIIPLLFTDTNQVPPPKHFLSYRFQKYDDIPAGVSMGHEHAVQYWTLGVTLCRKDSSNKRYGLTAAHNFDFEQRFGQHRKSINIVQPSRSVQDRGVDGKKVYRVVGKVYYYCHLLLMFIVINYY